MTNATRRSLAALAALPLVGLASVSGAANGTPRSAEGPYYPTEDMRFADIDNDLVKIEGEVRAAGGEVLLLSGRVQTRGGAPAAGATIEIWQCDAGGRYLHTSERGDKPRDAAFQGFGRTITDETGAYAFRTIRPVSYPGRTPHIHVKAFHGGRSLTTQLYIAGHKQNADDVLYRRLTADERATLEMALIRDGEGWRAVRDIML